MNDLLHSLIFGIAQGSIYALIALSFVVIFRATGVLNFAQPALMILGAFATSVFAVDLGLNYFIALVLAMIVIALLSMGIERVAIRPMVGQSTFSAALITVGIFIALYVISTRLFDSKPRTVNDPWGISALCLGGNLKEEWGFVSCEGGLIIYWHSIGKIVLAAFVIAALFFWLARSKYGLAMRATSMDQETALAQGINVGGMFSTSWGISGAIVALAGGLFAANGSVIQSTDALFALVALPALVLGGLDSLKGAVIGGLTIGILMNLTKTYQTAIAPWLGLNFENVVPYIVMIIVLLIRPYGLFGTKEVQRV